MQPSFKLNEQGFMTSGTWCAEIAQQIARQQGITNLTEKHWQVINFIREHHQRHGLAPMIRAICNENNISVKTLYMLFPHGPAKGACAIAGLPKATGCV